MHKFWIQAAMVLGGVIRGSIGGALSYLNTLLKSGFTSAMKFHQEGIAFARELGMNAKEAQAYTAVFTERTEKLAMTYGVAAKQVKELQRNISVATGRQLMLNDAQAEQFLQLNKLVGSSTVSQFTEEIMNGMGGSLDAVSGAVSKAYATAAKSGLNAQKVSEKIASNLGMANRLSFRNGVEGLTRMAIQAEKMGMKLQSIESAAEKFLDLDKAIENAAHMQMLGGSAAASFGNPLTAAFEANYDPEAFANRLQESLASYATFDAKSGVANVNGMNMDFVRAIGQQLGIGTEEATRIAKKQSEVKYKESHISNVYERMGLSKEQIDFLINKSNVSNGKVEFTTANGEKVDLSGGQAVNRAVIDEMMKYNNMSDRDIMEENAKSLTSINEQLLGIKESIVAMFSKFIQGLFPDLQGDIKDFGAWAKNNLEPIAMNVGEAVRGVYDWFKENKDTIQKLTSGIFGFIKFATEHWKLTLLALGSLKFLKLLGNAGIIGNSWASGAASRINGIASKMHQGSAHQLFKQRYANHTSRVVSFGQAAKSTWRATSKLAKGTAALGALTGVIQGVGAFSEFNRRKEEIANSNMSEAEKTKELDAARIDKNSEVGGAVGAGVGTVLGTFFFGPLGGMIGGAVGEFAGKFIGEYWDPIANTITSIFKKIGDGLVWIGKKLWDGVTWLVDNNPIGLMVKGVGKIFGKDWSITKGISSLFGGGEKHAEGGFINTGAVGVETPTLAQKGEVILNPTQQKNFMALANDAPKVQAKPVGEKEYIYITNKSETSNINGNTITVKDFNINLSGTLKLDGGNNSKNIDVAALLNDYQFINSLKELIKTSINNDMNGGRMVNDIATMRGHVSPLSIIH